MDSYACHYCNARRSNRRVGGELWLICPQGCEDFDAMVRMHMITFNDDDSAAFMEVKDLVRLRDYGEAIPSAAVGKMWRRREPVYGDAEIVTYRLFAWRFTAGSDELKLREWPIFLNNTRDQVRIIRGGVLPRDGVR